MTEDKMIAITNSGKSNLAELLKLLELQGAVVVTDCMTMETDSIIQEKLKSSNFDRLVINESAKVSLNAWAKLGKNQSKSKGEKKRQRAEWNRSMKK